MIILALDTSGTTASAAIMDDNIILAESSVSLKNSPSRKTLASEALKPEIPSETLTPTSTSETLTPTSTSETLTPKAPSTSEALMPMIDRLFQLTGMSLQRVDRIACTCGPGSFTGLRIGAATARGLAFATGKNLIAVPTLDAMAYTISCLNIPWVIPMMDARRGQVYTALYHNSKRVTDYLAEPVEDILELLKGKLKTGENIVFMGDGSVAYRDKINTATLASVGIAHADIESFNCASADFTPVSIAPECHNFIRASMVGALALTMPPAKESEFSLLYIRKPQAQRELEEKISNMPNGIQM